MVKPNKYGAKKIRIDGIMFDSLFEGRRYSFLKLREKAGEISHFDIHPKYDITINGVYVGYYEADFRYFTQAKDGARGELVVEDCKGFKTDLYRWKKKCTEACYPGVKIVEVTR